jgi:hypothetical protein
MDKRTVLMAVAMVALLAFDQAQAGVVDDYNAKPLASGRSGVDSRWLLRDRAASDPEAVLGKDWRRSYWAFSPSLAAQLISQVPSRPPQPPYLTVEMLSPGLEGIELRVSWDTEENLYRCSYHMFLSPDVPVLLPSRFIGGTVSIPRFPAGIGPDDTNARREWLGTTVLIPTVQMLGGPTIVEAIYKSPTGNLTYVAFYQGSTCGALAHSSAEKKLEFGVVIDPKKQWHGVTKKVGDRIYAVFAVPPSLIKTGAPYFRRAEKINSCYLRERQPQDTIAAQSAEFRTQWQRECQQLRTLPIDSTEKPFDAK